jgi:hypothetical protein
MPRNRSEKELELPQAVSNVRWLIRRQPQVDYLQALAYLKARIPRGENDWMGDEAALHWASVSETLRMAIRNLDFEEKALLLDALLHG